MQYTDRGYVRLNRDERGGTLRELADALETGLSSGVRRIVLDNTYLTRAARSHVIETRAPPRGPGAVRVARHAARAGPGQPRRAHARPVRHAAGARRAQTARAPVPRRARADLADEDRPRARAARDRRGVRSTWRRSRSCAAPAPDSVPARAGVFVAAAALERPGWEQAIAHGDPSAPHLLFHWSPGDTPDVLEPDRARLAAAVAGPVDTALCPHPGGPPTCWCRPPLPGLPLAFARTHGVDPARSILIGTGPAHRNLATALGARYVGL